MRAPDIVADILLRAFPIAARDGGGEPLLVDGAAARADILRVMLVAKNIREEALARVDRLARVGGDRGRDESADIGCFERGGAPNFGGAARDVRRRAARG